MITFLAVILILYILTRFAFPYLLPRLLAFWMKQYQKKSQYGRSYQQPAKPEGEISIDYIPKQKTTTTPQNNQGDYVDFEELKNE